MTFTKVDHSILTDSEFNSCGMEAQWLFRTMLDVCNEQETDGIVSPRALTVRAAIVGRTIDELRPAIAELVATDLWQAGTGPDGEYWVFRSFLKHNKSAAEIEEFRERERNRAKRNRKGSS